MMMTYDLKGPGGVSVTASAFAGEGMLQSLGLELQQGRDSVASDYTDLDLSSRNGPTDTGATTPLILTAALEIGEHTSELQSLMRISYAVFCLKKKKTQT